MTLSFAISRATGAPCFSGIMQKESNLVRHGTSPFILELRKIHVIELFEFLKANQTLPPHVYGIGVERARDIVNLTLNTMCVLTFSYNSGF